MGKPALLVSWLALFAALVGIGRWAQQLEDRISAIEHEQQYLHGTITIPKE